MTRENGGEIFLSRDESGNRSGNDPGNPMWRDGAMTHTPISEGSKALRSLSEHVARRSRTPEARRLAARIALTTGPGDADLAELVARRDTDGAPAARVLERLATEAPDEPLAALALLAMLRRDLEIMSARLARSGLIEAAEAEADTLAAAWEVVTRRPPPGRWERRDTIWNEARRSTGMRRCCPLELVALPDGFDRAQGEDDALERWPGLLAAAVAAGVLSTHQVVIVAETRMEGRALREVASALGRPYGAVRKERQRAEAALRTFALRYGAGGS